jgi:hypothetical protein
VVLVRLEALSVRSGGTCMLASETIEELGEGSGVFDHWKVTAGDLDRLDAQKLPRHEPLPVRLEDLVLGRVHEHRRDIRMAS